MLTAHRGLAARTRFARFVVTALAILLQTARAGSAPATFRLAGNIRDAAGRPVAGARVRVPDLDLSVTTGSEGEFTFESVPAGSYEVIADKDGYLPASQVVTMEEGSAVSLAMEKTPLQVPPVNVTATRSAADPLTSPLATSELGGERLRRNQDVSLAHALEVLPGMRALSTGEQIGKPMIRGLSGPRVLVLDHGQRIEDYSWSDEDGPSADVALAQRVEVVRGPISVLYGSDALGGVVNVIAEDVPNTHGGPSFHRGRLSLNAASNSIELGSLLCFEGAKNDWGWRVSGIGRFASDFHTPDGELPHTGFLAVNGEGAVGVRRERSNAMLRFAHYGGEFKLHEAGGPPPGAEEEEEGPERKLADERLQFNGNHFFGSTRLETRAQWQRHWLSELADSAELADTLVTLAEEGKEITIFDLLLNTFTLDLIAHHARSTTSETSLGVSGGYQTNDTRGPEPLVPDANTLSGAAFLFNRTTYGRWTVLAGARADVRRLEADANADLGNGDETRDYTAYTGDIGGVYRPMEYLALAANAGVAWRAPTLFELFSNGPHVGESRYERGDPDLDPERELGLDGSVRWQAPFWRAEVSIFQNRIEDYIFIAPTGDSVGAFPEYLYSQAKATLTGGEAWVEAEPWEPLTLRVRTDFVRGDNDETGAPLPLMPPDRYAFDAELHSTEQEAEIGQGRHYVGATIEWVADQDRLSPYDIPTDSYALLHLKGGVERPFFGRPMQIDAQLKNVTNKSYRDYLSRYKAFALDPGFNLIVRVTMPL